MVGVNTRTRNAAEADVAAPREGRSTRQRTNVESRVTRAAEAEEEAMRHGGEGGGGSSGYVLEWLELDNFKSYSGTHRLGPFTRGINAIIGPNGSGKSNVMDAIAFVLGSKSKDLRCATSLKDLIHAPTPQSQEAEGSRRGGRRQQNERAVVSATLLAAGTDGGSDRRLKVERSCNTSGSCQYRVDGRTVSWDDYRDVLRRAGVLASASAQRASTTTSRTETGEGSAQGADDIDPSTGGTSFLFVFQGEVDGIASRSAKELCKVFENASGSALLKGRYEELLDQKKVQDEKIALAYSKKRGVAAEKRDIRAQKEEAERYIAKKELLEKDKLELALSRLYFRAQRLASMVTERDAMQESVQGMRSESETLERQLNKARTEGAKLQREAAKTTKSLKRLKKGSEHGSASFSLKQVEGEISQVVKKLRSNEAKMKQVAEQHAAHEGEIAKLQSESDEKKKELEAFEADASKKQGGGKGGKGGKGKGQVMGGLTDEYNKLKAEAGKQSARLEQEKVTLERKRAAEADSLLALETEVKELNRRMQQLEAERVELDRSHDEKKEALASLKKDLQSHTKHAKELSSVHKKNTARRDHLVKKSEELEGQMREAKSYRKEKERDARMLSAINNLKGSVSGVHGRLSELCKISESKYKMAITVAFGKNMDAVVVDDVSTAKECITWLKSHFLPPMMFLPLKTIKARPINEKCRHLGGTSTLAYDIIQFSPQFERVVRFVCGNTLVCESHSEAKLLAYGQERRKVVTIDGTLIDKAGTITGGKSQGMERLVQRWDEARMQDIKRSYEGLSKELKQLPSLNQMLASEQENHKAIEGMQSRVQFVEAEMKTLVEKRRLAQNEATTLDGKKKKQIPILQTARDNVARLTAQSDGIASQVNDVTDRVFRDFSKKVGVQNIREYEESQLKAQQEIGERRLQLKTEMSHIASQLEYERKRDTAGPLKKCEGLIATSKAKLESLKKREVDLRQKQEKEGETVKKLEAELKTLKEQCATADEETKGLKKAFMEISKRAKDVDRKIEGQRGAIDQHTAECEDVLQSALIDHIELPTVKKANKDPTSTLKLGDKVYTFQSLDSAVKALQSEKEQRNYEDTQKHAIQSASLELNKENPNLKAGEQYDKASEQEKVLGEELEAVRSEGEAISGRFQDVKMQRLDAFMKCFDTVASTIDGIYKELTGGLNTHGNPDSTAVGGTAYLSLENPDEPFLAGVKYTAMPPTKRFRDMTDLSGGEKTVAALALLFALNLSSPTRADFFVLDEIDAALDSTNVSRVAQFLQHRKTDFQTIVISLKDTFYDKADHLHGVCRNPDSGFSQVFSLDLQAFA